MATTREPALLAEHLERAHVDGRFSRGAFFNSWFREAGQRHYFLFKKNLRVTNVQFAELLALLPAHITALDGSPTSELQVMTGREFENMMNELVAAFTSPGTAVASRAQIVADLFEPLLRRLIVVNTFYGSCPVHLPPGLHLDLAAVCGYAGYVHSCGDTLYIRNLSKATFEEFLTILTARIEKLAERQRLFFLVYAHEDFTPYDRDDDPDRHVDGLDDVKIHLNKYFLGGLPLVECLNRLAEQFGDRIVIPPPGDYRRHRDLVAAHREGLSNAVWLLVDRGISTTGFPSDDRYFVCYEQRFKNDNPFHLFDENMPGWVDHTTLPHTLADAMVNITRAGWPQERDVTLVDPFVGTGTTWLSAAKYPHIDPRCSDKLPISQQLLRDNLDFFTQSSDQLADLANELEALDAAMSEPDSLDDSGRLRVADTPLSRRYNAARDIVDRYLSQPLGWGADVLSHFRGADFETRLLFYIGLRTGIRHLNAFRRLAESWCEGYLGELREFRSQLAALEDIRLRGEAIVLGPPRLAISERTTYSEHVTVDSVAFRSLLTDVNVKRHDVLKSSLPPIADVVIADPPYGFNTDEDLETLARLYQSFCDKAVASATETGGQIVICLVDRAFTGRRSAFFTHKEYVTGELHAAASARGLELIPGDELIHHQAGLFRPPYYWESGRALRRAILHFKIRAGH